MTAPEYLTHGTNSCYHKTKCRCADCKRAHTEYSARYRARLYKRGFKYRDGYLITPGETNA